MRAKAGEVASEAGAYRCACCNQRVFVSDGDIFERCTGCDASIFETDWRYIHSLPHHRPFDRLHV